MKYNLKKKKGKIIKQNHRFSPRIDKLFLKWPNHNNLSFSGPDNKPKNIYMGNSTRKAIEKLA